MFNGSIDNINGEWVAQVKKLGITTKGIDKRCAIVCIVKIVRSIVPESFKFKIIFNTTDDPKVFTVKSEPSYVLEKIASEGVFAFVK